MSENAEQAFNPLDTYVFLEGEKALPVELTPSFWAELSSGESESELIQRVARGEGWLLSAYKMSAHAPCYEMHPAGDELITVMSGTLRAVIEAPEGNMQVVIEAGKIGRIPQGLWHRLEVIEPARVLAITYGKGTEQRSI